MFGLSFEKFFLLAIITGLVIGPRRLPSYTRKAAGAIRAFRDFVSAQRQRAEAEYDGVLTRDEWLALDPRKYDPRRIVREAMTTPYAGDTRDASRLGEFDDEVLAQAARVTPGQEYLVVGTSAHPRRIRLDALPVDDPRRQASAPLDQSDDRGGGPTEP